MSFQKFRSRLTQIIYTSIRQTRCFLTTKALYVLRLKTENISEWNQNALWSTVSLSEDFQYLSLNDYVIQPVWPFVTQKIDTALSLLIQSILLKCYKIRTS